MARLSVRVWSVMPYIYITRWLYSSANDSCSLGTKRARRGIALVYHYAKLIQTAHCCKQCLAVKLYTTVEVDFILC